MTKEEENAKKEHMYKCLQNQSTDNQGVNENESGDYKVIMKAFLALILQKEREIIQLQQLLKIRDDEIEKMKTQHIWDDTNIRPLKLQSGRNIIEDTQGMKEEINTEHNNEVPLNDAVKLKGDASIDEQIQYFDGKFFRNETDKYDDSVTNYSHVVDDKSTMRGEDCEMNRSFVLETKQCRKKAGPKQKFLWSEDEFKNRYSTSEIEASVIMLRKDQKYFREADEIGETSDVEKISSEHRSSKENGAKGFEELIPSFQDKRVSIERQSKEIHLSRRTSRAKSVQKEKVETKKGGERAIIGYSSTPSPKKLNSIEDKIISKTYGASRDI